jgi:predicted enzyme related to lactoylglutathione lyase
MMGMPDGTGSHWTIYFGVADIQAAVAAAEQNGGTIMAPPFETPYGIMSAIQDPGGAYFWAMQTDGSNMPDR